MHPCCCELEFRNKFLTIVCMILDVALIFFDSLFLFVPFHDHLEGHPELNWDEIYRRREASLNVSYIVLSVSLVHLTLTSFAYCSNKKVGASIWFIAGLVICFIAWLIGSVACIIYNSIGLIETPYVIATVIIAAIFYTYQVYVSYSFLKEVKNKRPVSNSQINSNVVNV